MRYYADQVSLCQDRYVAEEYIKILGQDFWGWMGARTSVAWDNSNMPFPFMEIEIAEALEPHRINLLLSPHYKALMKAWFINERCKNE